MKYLLDTCALLWFAEDSSDMSDAGFAAIEDRNNETYVSTISFWELSMKAVVGKLVMPMLPAALERMVIDNGLTVLPLTVSHVDRFHRLPTAHRDAFDRLIAAVALDEGHTLITPDPAFDALGVVRLW